MVDECPPPFQSHEPPNNKKDHSTLQAPAPLCALSSGSRGHGEIGQFILFREHSVGVTSCLAERCKMRCVLALELATVFVVLAISPTWGQNPFLGASGFGGSGFGGFGGEALPELFDEDVTIVEGSTPPNVVIERIVSFPSQGKEDLVVLRNLGGQTADLTGWSISGKDRKMAYEFGKEGCEDHAFIAPSERLVLSPLSEENECGFEFSIRFRDSINMYDSDGGMVTAVEWDQSNQGTAIRRLPTNAYRVVSETRNVLGTLQELGNFKSFLRALKATGLDRALMPENDPEYKGLDEALFKTPEPDVQPQFPSWFGFEFNRSTLPPPPPPPSPVAHNEGVPKMGPYTLLAPTDVAFDNFRALLVPPGQNPMGLDTLLKLPELKDILLYHILPGLWESNLLRNNTAIFTAKGVEVVPFRDGAMGEGKIMLHDSCVDKPTPDPYECSQQVEFDKCRDLFMTSPLGAQWQGGFCERTCERCTCNGATQCAWVEEADVVARNGIVHTVNRVMFPPPKFEKAIPDTVPSEEEDAETEPLSRDSLTKPDLIVGLTMTDTDSTASTG